MLEIIRAEPQRQREIGLCECARLSGTRGRSVNVKDLIQFVMVFGSRTL